jgi:hypothetical protein
MLHGVDVDVDVDVDADIDTDDSGLLLGGLPAEVSLD